MSYDIQLCEVAPQLTAVVRLQAKHTELATVVPQGCGEVWSFIRATGLPNPGRNLALYLDGVINLEVGVEVSEPFEGNERIFCSSTPTGAVVTTAYFGPYNRMGEAHAAIHKYCAEQGQVLAGVCWELYGHWTDNPAELRTDIYYLLK